MVCGSSGRAAGDPLVGGVHISWINRYCLFINILGVALDKIVLYCKMEKQNQLEAKDDAQNYYQSDKAAID